MNETSLKDPVIIKMENIIIQGLIVMLIALLTGCAATHKSTSPYVGDDNIFYSNLPKVRIKIDPIIKFQAMIESNQSQEYQSGDVTAGKKGSWRSKLYLFAHPEKFVFISIKTLTDKNAFWLKMDPTKFNRLIKHTKTGGYDEWMTFNEIPLSKADIQLILSKLKGFNDRTDGLVHIRRRIAGMNKNILFILGYIEKTTTRFPYWVEFHNLPKETADEVKQFEMNANKAVKVL